MGPALAVAMGLGRTPIEVVALACAVPSHILARPPNGETVLIATLATTTTVAELATLPAVMTLARALS